MAIAGNRRRKIRRIALAGVRLRATVPSGSVNDFNPFPEKLSKMRSIAAQDRADAMQPKVTPY
jgi:hypothetical protein